jgi:hypothetical protein
MRRLRRRADAAADDADFHWTASPRDRQPFFGEILKMQFDGLARRSDGAFDGPSSGRATDDVGYRDPVKIRIVGLFDLDPETQPARTERGSTA